MAYRELSGVEGYFDAYHARSIEPIIHKYGKIQRRLKMCNRLPARLSGWRYWYYDRAFENVPVLIKLWKADSLADANMYFDI